MIEGTIKEIRYAEQEAANIVADAKRQSEKISEEAKLASEKLYSDMISEAQQKAKKLRDSAETFGKQQTDEALFERALFGNTAENRRKGKRACEKK